MQTSSFSDTGNVGFIKPNATSGRFLVGCGLKSTLNGLLHQESEAQSGQKKIRSTA